MFVRIPSAILLLLSLLFAGFTMPSARGEVSECVEMMCVKGCCPMKACCEAGQQQAPSAPESLAPRPELQLIAPSFQVIAETCVSPARTWHFITVDERSGAHAPPPLARSCIRLI